MNKKKPLKLDQIKDFLLTKGLTVIKKKKIIFLNKDLRSLYLTILCSIGIIMFSFVLPVILEFKNNTILASKEIENNSKSNFEKVLDGEALQKSSEIDEGLNLKNLFDDVFKFDDLPSDTVRLSASTIEQLFKETDYNLKDVRKTKLVKPVRLSLLPNEMKMIESTEKRKNLFIQIILPLIIEENNRIKLNRKKLFSILNKNHNSNAEKKWLNEKFKQYGVLNKDLSTLKVRMDVIPTSLAIAQAAKETGWGTSRFALKGNALFGQWTWSGEGLKPKNAEEGKDHKVMKFHSLRLSVRAYLRNLNTHSSYKNLRKARTDLRNQNIALDSLILSKHLDKYAETGTQYVDVLKKIIEQNNLKDFDEARLLPSSKDLESLI